MERVELDLDFVLQQEALVVSQAGCWLRVLALALLALHTLASVSLCCHRTWNCYLQEEKDEETERQRDKETKAGGCRSLCSMFDG